MGRPVRWIKKEPTADLREGAKETPNPSFTRTAKSPLFHRYQLNRDRETKAKPDTQ
ncbi:MAG: hypothetical protein ACE5R6_19720 [Candidatus Heimdallarchaeota archaeon]